jgi:nucleoside-diphosphate-sugar epimerase
MSLHLITGAGPVGSATMLRLAADGQQVRIVTRSGTGPDAADPGWLSRAATRKE